MAKGFLGKVKRFLRAGMKSTPERREAERERLKGGRPQARLDDEPGSFRKRFRSLHDDNLRGQ